MNAIKLQKGKWYPVVDFPDYEINSDGQLRSFKHGSPRVLRNKSCAPLRRDGKRYTFNSKNILLSVKLGVSPECTKNLYFVEDKDGEHYLTKDEFNKTLVSKSVKERVYTSEMVERSYDETARLIVLIREYYITEDLSDLSTFLLSFKQETIAYLYKKRYVFRSEDADSCWSAALEATLIGITKRDKIVVAPSRYLKLAARNYARQTTCSRLRFKSYDENLG